MPGRYAAKVLSRGEQFTQVLLPITHGVDVWPGTSTVETIFYATDGGVLSQITGLVEPDQITFDSPPEDVDMVPAGAHFETFLTDHESKKHQVEYGQVIRKQAFFAQNAALDSQNVALQFSEDFSQRVPGLVGRKWATILGKPTIFDNSGAGKPNAVGPDTVFFVSAAMRFHVPLNSNSWLLSFTLLNPGAGKTAIFASCNATMTSGMYAMFESGVANNRIHMGRATGPVTLVDQVATVNHTVVDNTNYKLRYDDSSKQLALLNSGMTATLASWTDSGATVPQGAGYRYFAVSWQASLLSSGVQVVLISAQDGLS